MIGEKPVPVKGLERTGRDFDPEPLGGQRADLAGMTLGVLLKGCFTSKISSCNMNIHSCLMLFMTHRSVAFWVLRIQQYKTT